MQIADALDIGRSLLYTWLREIRQADPDAVRPLAPKRLPTLSESQRQEIIDILEAQRPADLNLKGRGWTRENVRALVEEKFGLRISLPNVKSLLDTLNRHTGLMRAGPDLVLRRKGLPHEDFSRRPRCALSEVAKKKPKSKR